MATSIRAFTVGLYQEHLEDAAFLYQQRGTLLRDPAVPWRRRAGFEERLEAHVDALVIGQDLALEVCRTRAVEGDPGELFPIVSVLCRQGRADLLSEVLTGVDLDDPEKARAIEDALKLELPREWAGHCEQALSRCPEGLTALLARTLGYQRLPLGPPVARALATAPPRARAALAWALGRVGGAHAADALVPCLGEDDVAVRSAAALALLRGGARDALGEYEALARDETWLLMPLALGGSRSAATVLLDAARSGPVTPECLLALGLLGDLSAVRTLHEFLPHPHAGAAAAVALELITGAALREEVFVPEEIVEDELFEDELTAWRERGQGPLHADGRPFGTTVKRIARSQARWRAWLTAHSREFDSNLRYRNGKPCSPETLLEGLLGEETPHEVRQLAGEELAVRYGCDVPFEADMPVTRQLHALRNIGEWIAANAGRFRPGLWYFAGQPV